MKTKSKKTKHEKNAVVLLQEILADDGVGGEEERRKRLFKGLKFFFGREVRIANHYLFHHSNQPIAIVATMTKVTIVELVLVMM